MRTPSISTAITAVGIAAAATAANAQTGEVTITWEWFTVQAGTTNVIQPAVPGKLSPGEGVEFRGTIAFLPETGTMVTNHNNQTGAVGGLAKVFADFYASDASGTFHDVPPTCPLCPVPPVYPDSVRGMQWAQIALINLPIPNANNPIHDAFILRWTPDDHADPTPRIMEFSMLPTLLAANAAELYIETAPLMWATYRIPNEHFTGGSIQIAIIPAPSGAAALSLACVLALRPRRRRA